MIMAVLVFLDADSNFGWQRMPFASKGEHPVEIIGDRRHIAATCVDRITGVGKAVQCPLWPTTCVAMSAPFRVRTLFLI